MFDDESGFWLVHSAPKYPPSTNTSYSYPENAVDYGQHFLCISLAGTGDVANVGRSCTCSSIHIDIEIYLYIYIDVYSNSAMLYTVDYLALGHC